MKILASALFLLVILLQLQLWFGQHGIFRLWALRDDVSQNTEQNMELEKRNLQLGSRVLELKEGQDALEENARNELGFIKDGEIFFRVIVTKPEETED